MRVLCKNENISQIYSNLWNIFICSSGREIIHGLRQNISVHSLWLICLSTECKKSVKGAEFRGTSFTKTVAGTTCQHWALDTPHSSRLNEPPYNMQELGLQGYAQILISALLALHADRSRDQIAMQEKNHWTIAPLYFHICAHQPVSCLQRTTAETLTMHQMVLGATPWIPTKDGSIVLFPCVWVSVE